MIQIHPGMCQDMETDILELVEEVIFVGGVVRFVMNACGLGHPRCNSTVRTVYPSTIVRQHPLKKWVM